MSLFTASERGNKDEKPSSRVERSLTSAAAAKERESIRGECEDSEEH
jgi:hypothetical protein